MPNKTYEDTWDELWNTFHDMGKRGVTCLHPFTCTDLMFYIKNGVDLYEAGRRDERKAIKEEEL